MVGACQYKIFRSPPAPRLATGAALGEGLEDAGVWVHAANAIAAVIARANPLRK